MEPKDFKIGDRVWWIYGVDRYEANVVGFDIMNRVVLDEKDSNGNTWSVWAFCLHKVNK